MDVRPFQIAVPETDVLDLHERLARTRLPDEVNTDDWGWGTDAAYLTGLLRTWRDDFDWRRREGELNELPHHVARIDGHDVHFVHARADVDTRARTGRPTVPLLVSHGWPGSFLEMVGLIPLLTGPSAITDEVGFCFDLVIPSLPGFGFSSRPTEPGTSPQRTSELFHTLMTGLGYDRYAVQGGDLGAAVSLRMARTHPEAVLGAHLNFPSFGWSGPDSEDGRRADERRRDWMREEGAYSHQHRTRPQTLGYALTDSPAGLAAWVVEKFHAWSDPTTERGPMPFSHEELLTNLSLYWFTRTITSSMRFYRDSAADPLVLSPEDPIPVPFGVALFPHEIALTQPRDRVAAVVDLRRWTEMPYGGHFAALEAPELLAGDVARFVASLSPGQA